jgi:hypothetical protein
MDGAFYLVFSLGFLAFFCLTTASCHALATDMRDGRFYLIPSILFILAMITIGYHYIHNNTRTIDEEEINLIVYGTRAALISAEIKYLPQMVWLLVIPIGMSLLVQNITSRVTNIIAVIIFISYYLTGLKTTFTFDTMNYFFKVLFAIIPVALCEYKFVKTNLNL